MRKFNIPDWVRIMKSIERHGNKSLVALWRFNYPIYCIHSIILDSTPSEVESLDKQIFSLVTSGVSMEMTSSILGLTHHIVKSRIEDLILHELIYLDADKYYSTEKGVSIFINKTQKLFRKRRYDFYTDGIDFKLLTKEFYKDSTISNAIIEDENSRVKFYPNIEHQPPSLDKIKQELFSKKIEEREDYSIPIGFEELEEISFTKMTYPLLISIECDSMNQYSYQVLNGFVSDPTLYSSSDFKNFESKLLPKFGQNLRIQVISYRKQGMDLSEDPIFQLDTNWNEINKYQDILRPFIGAMSDFQKIINKRYYSKFEVDDIQVLKGRLSVNINKSNFQKSSERIKIINNLNRGSDIIQLYRNDTLEIIVIEFNTVDNYIIELQKLLTILNKESNSKELIFEHLEHSPYPPEQLLLDLEKHSILEELAIEKHFKFLSYE